MRVITTTKIEITPEEYSIVRNFQDMLYDWKLKMEELSHTSIDLDELPETIETCFDALGDLVEEINETDETEW